MKEIQLIIADKCFLLDKQRTNDKCVLHVAVDDISIYFLIYSNILLVPVYIACIIVLKYRNRPALILMFFRICLNKMCNV